MMLCRSDAPVANKQGFTVARAPLPQGESVSCRSDAPVANIQGFIVAKTSLSQAGASA